MENENRRDREKKIHENEIILAAEELFRRNGYENTSMDDIAREAQFTRRTIYQYFASKESLFFAVIQKGMLKFQSYLASGDFTGLNGYEKIEQTVRSCYRFFQDYPEFFRLLNHVGKTGQTAAATGENRQTYFTSNDTLFRNSAALISAGQADGSIAADLDARMTSMSFIFLMTAFFNQLAITGGSFSSHFNLDVQDFSNFTLDLILRTLQTRPNK